MKVPYSHAAQALVRSCVIMLFCSTPPLVARGGELRGGIEIGAKGVKATVLEVGEGAARKLMTEVSNTTVAAGVASSGKYAADAIRDTAQEAARFALRMRDEFHVPADRIRIVGSSGLPQASNRQELVDAVHKATGLSAMEFLDPCREAELTIRGLVPETERKDVLLIDVGSGNTKGAYLGSGTQPLCFSVPLGSVTYANRVTKDAAGKPFAEAADSLRASLLDAPFAAQVKANNDLLTRPVVYLSGGAPYALATLMHPEAVKDHQVALTANDISEYLHRLRSNESVPQPDFGKIADSQIRDAAKDEVKSVLDTFNR